MSNRSMSVVLLSFLGLGACAHNARPDGEADEKAEQRAAAGDEVTTEPQMASQPPMESIAPEESAADQAATALDPSDAKATFAAAPSATLEGSATLNQQNDGVKLEVEISKASPGLHGIHIHETADCSDISGNSMGQHFAPLDRNHGLPGAPSHHLGDLGNLRVDEDGEADMEVFVRHANLRHGDRLSLLGKAIVVHELEDKGVGPSGESGAPIACAPIIAD